MGTGWNITKSRSHRLGIITDWDMGTGWNILELVASDFVNYNRLGYGYWLEL